jgi:hypothetical protein
LVPDTVSLVPFAIVFRRNRLFPWTQKDAVLDVPVLALFNVTLVPDTVYVPPPESVWDIATWQSQPVAAPEAVPVHVAVPCWAKLV